MANISLANLYVLFKARGLTRLKTRINILKRDLVGVSNHLDNIEHKAKIAFMGAGVAIGAAVWQAAKFQEQMANINTLLTGADSQYLPQYANSIKNLSIKYGESSETVSKGLYDILSATIPASKAQKVLEYSMKAARAGMTDTGTTASAITTIINSFGVSADSTGSIVDKMFQVVKRGVLTPEEYANNIGKISGTAHIAGLSIEEMNAGVASLTRGGIVANRAMAHFVGFIRAFTKPTKEATETAAKYGIELSDVHLRTVGLLGAVRELSKLPEGVLTKIFGDIRGYKAAAVFLNDMDGLTTDYNEQINSFGAGEEATKKAMDTMMMSLQQIREAFLVILKDGGMIFTPVIKGISSFVQALGYASPLVKQVIFGLIALKGAATGLELLVIITAKIKAARAAAAAAMVQALKLETAATVTNAAAIAAETAAMGANTAAKTKNALLISMRGRGTYIPGIEEPTAPLVIGGGASPKKVLELSKGFFSLSLSGKGLGAVLKNVGKGFLGMGKGLLNVLGILPILKMAWIAFTASLGATILPLLALVSVIAAVGVTLDKAFHGGKGFRTRMAENDAMKEYADGMSQTIDTLIASRAEIARQIEEIQNELKKPLTDKERSESEAQLQRKLIENVKNDIAGFEAMYKGEMKQAWNAILTEFGPDKAEAAWTALLQGMPILEGNIHTDSLRRIPQIIKSLKAQLQDLEKDEPLKQLNVAIMTNAENFKKATDELAKYITEFDKLRSKIQKDIKISQMESSSDPKQRGAAARMRIEEEVNAEIEKIKLDHDKKIAKFEEDKQKAISKIIAKSVDINTEKRQEALNKEKDVEINSINTSELSAEDKEKRIAEIEKKYEARGEEIKKRAEMDFRDIERNRELQAEQHQKRLNKIQTITDPKEKLRQLNEENSFYKEQQKLAGMSADSENIYSGLVYQTSEQFDKQIEQTKQAIDYKKLEADLTAKAVENRAKGMRQENNQLAIGNKFEEAKFAIEASSLSEYEKKIALAELEYSLAQDTADARMAEAKEGGYKEIIAQTAQQNKLLMQRAETLRRVKILEAESTRKKVVLGAMGGLSSSVGDLLQKITEITDPNRAKNNIFTKMKTDMYKLVDEFTKLNKTTDTQIAPGLAGAMQYGAKQLAQAANGKQLKANIKDGVDALENLQKQQKSRDMAGQFIGISDVWKNLQSSAAKPTISLTQQQTMAIQQLTAINTKLEAALTAGVPVAVI